MDKQQRDSAASWVKRAEINLDVYDIRGALKYIQTAIDKDPKYIKSYIVRARIGFLKKNHDKALEDVHKVLELDPENVEALSMQKALSSYSFTPLNSPVPSAQNAQAPSSQLRLSTTVTATPTSDTSSTPSPSPSPTPTPTPTSSSNPTSSSTSISGPSPIPPHAHQGPLPIYLLTNNQKYTIPAGVTRRGLPDTQVNTTDCREKFCTAARMDMDYVITDIANPEVVLREATEWLSQFYKEKKLSDSQFVTRMTEVSEEIKQTGTYFQTYDELSYACKVAWRNAARCINRIQWSRMEIIDCRNVTTAEGVFEKCMEHIRFATNRGNIITTMTVFAQQKAGQVGPRIWNIQLLRYAGYQQPDGSVIGDPSNIEMTEAVQKLGWVGEGTRFDVLPIVVQMPGEQAKMFSIPQEDVLVIQINHPRYEWFAQFDLQWFAIPLVSNIGLTCGGIQYTCTPFNGWFMGTELSRNLGDPQRYDMLPRIATKLGLDPAGPPSSLWQEKANVELNIAILYSFQHARVSMVDHHTAAAGFMNFWDAEHAAGRAVPGDWVWLVPPCAGSVSPLFHLEMANWLQKPAYFPLEFPGKHYKFPRQKRRSYISLKGLVKMTLLLAKFMAVAYGKRHQVQVLYATETGNSERYARRVAKFLSLVATVKVDNMATYDFNKLEKEEAVIFAVSTFGGGDPPAAGVTFKQQLGIESTLDLHKLQYAVFGLGSTLYADFAAFGAHLDKRMALLRARRITPLVKGDEIAGSELAFKTWIVALWTALSPLWGINMADYEVGLKSLGVSSDGADAKSKYVSNYELAPSKPKDKPPAASTIINRTNPYVATLKENAELLNNTQDNRSTRKIVFAVAADQVKFTAGDHLAILPSNRPELVEELLERLHVKEPDAYFEFKHLNSEDTLSTPFTTLPFTIREAFTDFIDITSPPKPELLDIFAHFAVHPGDRAELQDLAKGTADFEAWQHRNNPTLPELLALFPVSVPLALLMEKLPQIQPRFYSISSSPKMFPNEVHMTVSVVKYHTPSGKQHYGVASNFLSNAKVGDKVRVFARNSDFMLPSSPATPVILVGPGTGIAPFRSFWQERAHLKDIGKAVLFFGCRSRTDDYIYEDEIEAVKGKKVLTHVSVAFSRETAKKVYVQDKILEEADLLWELINEGAHIYVCGDVTMANDVKDKFKEVLQRKGLGIQQSNKYIEDLIAAKRYLIDVFGPTLHVKKSLGHARERAMSRTFKTSLIPFPSTIPTQPLTSSSPSSSSPNVK